MFNLAIPKIECIETRDNFGHFVAEPLEKGFGVTLGNVIRRVLLGYLPGAAVTRVIIEGIQHELSTIPHVKEDVTEFLLNVKALRLNPVAGRPGKLELEVEGEGQIYAADIKPTADFEIANPELYLATLDSSDARLYVEFNVELGEGFKVAESSDDLPIGTIPMDAIFTPIRKVNYTVEPTHIGQETSLERLHLEVWTDGSISPVDAISRSAEILVEQLSPFVNCAQVFQVQMEKELISQSIPDEQYNMPVEKLDLSVRTMNCLRRAGITTVGELISKGEKEMMALRNFGQKSKQEIDERLEAIGLSLTPQIMEEVEGEPGETEKEPLDTAVSDAGMNTDSTTENEAEKAENQPEV